MPKKSAAFTLVVDPKTVTVRKRMPRPGVAMASRREKTPRHRQDYLEQARRWG